MEKEQFIKEYGKYIGGIENVSRTDIKDGVIYLRLKDTSVVSLEDLRADGRTEIKIDRGRLEIRLRNIPKEENKMEKNHEIAVNVLNEVGGADNVADVTHCMTRLRLVLKDDASVSDEKVKAINGVVSVIHSGGQYQVVIGQNVSKVYDEFLKLGNFKTETEIEDKKKEPEKRTFKTVMNNVMNYISGSMVGILPIILSAALLKSVICLLGPDLLGWISADGQLASLLNMVYNAGFYFFPVYIGYTAAKRLNTSVPLAMFLGGVLVCPDMSAMAEAGESFSVFGIDAPALNYGSTVLPMLMIVAVMAVVYKYVGKFMPTALNSTITPLVTIIIMLPVSLCFLAPLGNTLGLYLVDGLDWVHSTFGFLGVGVMAAIYFPLVITGMHSPVCAIAFTQLFTTGSENFIFLGGSIAGYALIGMDLALYLRMKDRGEKATILGALVSLLASNVSEPTLYGVALPRKKSFLMMLIGAFVGGCWAGLFHCAVYSAIYIFPISLLQFSGGTTVSFIQGIVASFIAIIVSFILTWLFGVSKEERGKKVVEKSGVCAAEIEGGAEL